MSQSAVAALDRLPVYVTVGQAAEYLGISTSQIANFFDSGELAAVNIGSPGAKRPAYRIARADLAAFERRRTTKL
ncbi:MAG TPA: helix-turn-helix domain-containing protein [Candidatus Saccharimonadales bacterium]|nr:helix-turn-helix domain-containing protein [Candidatus Saccharimonadales bacterium]